MQEENRPNSAGAMVKRAVFGILGNLPLIATAAAGYWLFGQWSSVAKEEEIMLSLFTFCFLLPVCGVICGVWYGAKTGNKLKWLLPVLFFALAYGFTVIAGPRIEFLTAIAVDIGIPAGFADIAIAALTAGLCLVFEMIASFMMFVVIKFREHREKKHEN